MGEDQGRTKAQLAEELRALRQELAEARSDLETSRFFDILVESLPHCVFCKDLQGRFTYANPAYCKVQGISLAELAGKTDFDVHAPEAAEKYRADDREVLRTGEIFQDLEENVPLQGESLFTHVVKAPIRDRDGKVLGVMGVFWDITELKKAEYALRESEAKYRSVIENIQDVFYRTDRDGRVVMASPSAVTVLGYDSLDEIIGKSVEQFYREPSERLRLLETIASRGFVREYDVTLRRKDGAAVQVSTNSSYYYDASGTVLGVEGVFRDITERKRAEEQLLKSRENLELTVQQRTRELLEANARLQDLDRLKSDFLSSVSHELRTPLTSILGFAGIIGRDMERILDPWNGREQERARLATRVMENAAIIVEESRRLTRLINDLLDLSKIESGRMEWRDQEIDLAQLARDAVKAIQGQVVVNPEVEFRSDIPDSGPFIFADPDRIKQLLLNLLNNAVKFTTRGRVTLSLKSAAGGWAQASVEDTGPGVAPDELKRIFESYYQVRKQDDAGQGTGLGLTICRQIVERYQGKLWAESELGRGARFLFRLPLLDR